MKRKLKKSVLGGICGLVIVGLAFGIVKMNEKDYLIKGGKENTTNVAENLSKEDEKNKDDTTKKIAYITIDDGPSKYTNQILDILDSNGVKATFFMIDGNMNRYPEEVKRMVEQGHGVGFHSVSHDKNIIYKSPEITVGEFDTCNETLYKISGKESKLIRLPYGSKPYMPQESYEKLIESEYLIWDWNLDTQDWKATTDQIVSNVLYYGREREEIILLIHEREQTIEALESTIRVLKERGYDILPITENNDPKNFWNENLK